MVKTTREQRKALKKVWQRTQTLDTPNTESYRQFRRKLQPGPGCVMIPYASMWLGIEPNGHTHS